MTFLENLNWRYATKKFDENKKVSEEDFAKICEAIRMAPTSLGVQPFQVVEVKEMEVRKKIKTGALNMSRLLKADRVLIFNVRKNVMEWVEEMFQTISGNDAEKRKVVYGDYENSVRKTLDGWTDQDLLIWAEKNAHVVLGFALAACAELKIDSCPIGGFDKDSTREALAMDAHLEPILLLAIGYRDESDEAIQIPKWRFPKANLFREI